MADLNLRKKVRASGSLTRRILFVAILLLVIPLFFQSFYLFYEEYEQKLADVKEDLSLLANERARFIEETLEMDWKILEQGRGVLGSSVVDGAGYDRSVGKLKYIERIPFPMGKKEHFVLVSKSQKALLVGIRESDTTALIMQIPFFVVARNLPRGFPIQISIRKNGKVLWENFQIDPSKAVIEIKDLIQKTDLDLVLKVEKAKIRSLHLKSYYLRIASLIFFVGVLGGGAVYFFTRRMAKPLIHLSKTMRRVSDGSIHARYRPDQWGFEINALGVEFNETLDRLLYHTELAEKERIGREKLAKELSIGHEIQSSLFPKHLVGFGGIDLATIFLASQEVNGDFYDFFKINDGRLLIAICDSAGKGISACLFSLILRSMIRSFATMVPDLSELIEKINDLYLIDAGESSMFSTIWLALFDPETKNLTYCSQGHPPAALVREGKVKDLWTKGIALGAQKMDKIDTAEITLKEKDLLVLYTDGVIEAHNHEKELFGKSRLYDILLKNEKKSARMIADEVANQIQLFTSHAVQHDDMTLCVLRIL